MGISAKVFRHRHFASPSPFMWMEVVQRRDGDGRLHIGPDLMGEFNECVMISKVGKIKPNYF